MTQYTHTDHVFVPADKLTDTQPYIDSFDPGADAEDEFALRFSATGEEPATYRAGAGIRATDAMHETIEACAASVTGVVVFNALQTTVSQAGASLGVFQIVPPADE